MILPSLILLVGLALLIWSADRFVDGSAAVAGHLGMPPLLIGMVIVGFGTSAPEMVVSAFAAIEGNPGIALGNAYGSNIANIALILGLTALIKPILVDSKVLRNELPVLTLITGIAIYQIWDGTLSRTDAWILLGIFGVLMGWSIREGLREREDPLGDEMEKDLVTHPMTLGRAIFWVIVGLVLLVVSSRALVWGAVEIARSLGVSDLIIGLTIVAVGTSLPELASSLSAIRKNEHEIALGNVLGSNLFNTLAVVGIAGSIHPFTPPPEILSRDMAVMSTLTLSLFVVGYGFGGQGKINRIEGALLLATFIGYTSWLVYTVIAA